MADQKHVLPVRLSTEQNDLLTQLARNSGQPVSRYVLAAIAAFVGADWPSSVDGRSRATAPDGARLDRASMPPEKLEHLRATDRVRSKRHRDRRAAATAQLRESFVAEHVTEEDR